MNFDTKDDNDRNKLVGVEEQSDWAKKTVWQEIEWTCLRKKI